jgi:hypothetical protein
MESRASPHQSLQILRQPGSLSLSLLNRTVVSFFLYYWMNMLVGGFRFEAQLL